MIPSRIFFLVVAFVFASIVAAEAWKGSSRNLRHQVALHGEGSRNLQNGPKHPDLNIGLTTGGKISATASFYQGGMQHIRLFTNDCVTKFTEPSVQFSVGNALTTDSEWSDKGSANTVVDFEIPLTNLHKHLTNINNDGKGEVDVCIELETGNTLKYTRLKVTLDLDGKAEVTVNAKQPDAVDADVSIETGVTAWVCNGTLATTDPDFTTPIDILEVPGKIYVCIEVTDGYEIKNGTLLADATQTGISPDKNITNYMNGTVLATGITGTYNVRDTFQVLSSNLVRVSFMGNKTWAKFAEATNELKITVDANFVPVRRFLTPQRRRLADEPAKKFQPGRLRINVDKSDEKFASYTTTVFMKSAPEPKKITAAMAGAISAGVLAVAAVFFFVVARRLRPNTNNPDEKSVDSNDTKSSLEFTATSSINVASESRIVRPNGSITGSGTNRGAPRGPNGGITRPNAANGGRGVPRGASRGPTGSTARPNTTNNGVRSVPRGAPRGPTGNTARPNTTNGGRGAPRGPSRVPNNSANGSVARPNTTVGGHGAPRGPPRGAKRPSTTQGSRGVPRGPTPSPSGY